MTLRFGSIIIHKPGPNSETDTSNISSDDAEVAEVAETATLKYSKKQITNRRQDRQRKMTNKSRSLDSRRSSTSFSASNDPAILRILGGDKSPPFVRSHYTLQIKEGLRHPRKERKNSISSEEEIHSDGERLGFKMLTSGSRTTDIAINRRRATSVIPDVTASFTTPFVIDEEAAFAGLTRLLKNLNFAEKLRQQKSQQERLDVHKLPHHIREQLKHMYVY